MQWFKTWKNWLLSSCQRFRNSPVSWHLFSAIWIFSDTNRYYLIKIQLHQAKAGKKEEENGKTISFTMSTFVVCSLYIVWGTICRNYPWRRNNNCSKQRNHFVPCSNGFLFRSDHTHTHTQIYTHTSYHFLSITTWNRTESQPGKKIYVYPHVCVLFGTDCEWEHISIIDLTRFALVSSNYECNINIIPK